LSIYFDYIPLVPLEIKESEKPAAGVTPLSHFLFG
jgi:hypothetical protein